MALASAFVTRALADFCSWAADHTDPGARLPGQNSPLHFVVVQSWISYLASLCLIFLICKIR